MVVPVSTEGSFTIPAKLVDIAWDNAVILNWPLTPGAVSYNLYRSTISGTGTGGTQIADVKPGYTDLSVSNGTTYYYIVTAVNSSAAEIAASDEASAQPSPVLVDTLMFKDADLGDYIHTNFDGSYVNTVTSVSHTYSGVSNLLGLEKLVHLGTCDLYGNKITDISSLSGLTALKWLNLNNNSITDINPLSGLTALKYLFLQNNNIRTGVRDLAGLNNALYIDLRGNPDISKEDIDYLKNALPECRIYSDYDDTGGGSE